MLAPSTAIGNATANEAGNADGTARGTDNANADGNNPENYAPSTPVNASDACYAAWDAG